jgi:hypothetical protein
MKKIFIFIAAGFLLISPFRRTMPGQTSKQGAFLSGKVVSGE